MEPHATEQHLTRDIVLFKEPLGGTVALLPVPVTKLPKDKNVVRSLHSDVTTSYLHLSPPLFIGPWLGLATHTSRRRNTKKQFSISTRV